MPLSTLPVLGFIFSSPLAAVGAAAAAVSIPILIHLLNRKRFRVVTWAAMRFLLAAQRQNVRRMRLEQIFLLVLRSLIVLLIVLAMASVTPWAEEGLWQQWFPGAAAAPTGPRTHKILVLDASLSMTARVGPQSCFDKARELALATVRGSARGDGFSVILMAAPPQRFGRDPSVEAERIIRLLQDGEQVRPTEGNADLGKTIEQIRDLLDPRRRLDQFEATEVYFFTDLQRATWTAHSRSELANLTRALGDLGKQATVVLLDVGQDHVPNLAVTNLELVPNSAAAGPSTPVIATLHNFGGKEGQQVWVELLVGRARLTANDEPFRLNAVQRRLVTVPPGDAGVKVPFSCTFEKLGDYVVQVRLPEDALRADNQRSLVVSVKATKDHVPVLLVNGKPATELYKRATTFLSTALNPALEGAAAGLPRPLVVNPDQFSRMARGELAPHDAVFLCDLAELKAPEVRCLERHLRRGGVVVFCLGPNVKAKAYNDLLYRDGAGILPGILKETQKAPPKQPFMFQADEASYQLPPLDAFAADADKVALLAPRFQEYVRVERLPQRARRILSFVPEPRAVKEPPTTAAKTPPRDPAVVEWSRYRGRVVLITSTVNMDWNTWPSALSFLPFMQELLKSTVGGRLNEQASLVGEPLEEDVPGGQETVTVYPPGAPSRQVKPVIFAEGTALLHYTDTHQSGVYRAVAGNLPREYLFAVNVPSTTTADLASESDLARAAEADLRGAFRDCVFQYVTDLKDVVHPKAKGAGKAPPRPVGPRIARGLLWAVLALLLLEVLLAWIFAHHTATAGPPGVKPASGWLVPVLLAGLPLVCLLLVAGVLVHGMWTGDFLSFLPDGLRRTAEEAMGVTQVPGEGVRWRLGYTPLQAPAYQMENWLAATDAWWGGGLFLAALALVAVVYRFEGRSAGAGYRTLLAALRASTLLLTIFVFLLLLRLTFERQGWADVVILIDDSQSMSRALKDTEDSYRYSPDVRKAAEQLAAAEALGKPAGELTQPQRLQLAQLLLTHKDGSWLRELLARHQVKLHIFSCSDKVAWQADVTHPAHVAEVAPALWQLQPTGQTSQLGDAIRQVIGEFPTSSLAAVIMLSDGIDTEEGDGRDERSSLKKAAELARSKGVPLFFVGLGDIHADRDLILDRLTAADTAYVNDTLLFKVHLAGHGYPGLTVPVTLFEKTRDGLKQLEQKTVPAHPQGEVVEFKHRPIETGEKVYILDVPVRADERHKDNNRLEHTVMVHDTKTIKVLYVEGYPRYEFRFLKTLLEREAAVGNRQKSIELKVVLLEAPDDFAAQDRSAIPDIPSKADLNQYDVIVLGDIDPNHPKVGPKNLENIAEFVRERGGGLLLIAGERFNPHAFADSPLKDVLPIEVTGVPPDPDIDREVGYRPVLTDEAKAGKQRDLFCPIFIFDTQNNDAIWETMPELYWWAEGFRPKPAAKVLAEKKKAEGGKQKDETQPLVVYQQFGNGRCMFYGMEETWRWRFRDYEPYYNAFWFQTMRFMGRKLLDPVSLDLEGKHPYRTGKPLGVIVRFLDENSRPGPQTEVKVRVEVRPIRSPNAPKTDDYTLTLTPVAGTRGTYSAQLPRIPEGDYRIWLSSPAMKEGKKETKCRIRPPHAGEMERLSMNQVGMQQAAAISRGSLGEPADGDSSVQADRTVEGFYTLDQADRLLADLKGKRVPLNDAANLSLWTNWFLFLLTLALLSAEWILRKRKHLL